jgi:high affinity sulfate transporter 1
VTDTPTGDGRGPGPTGPGGGPTAGRILRVAPGLAVLRHYPRAWLRPDLVAGVTVAAYLVPQCMAYAELAGLAAVTGLWAALAPMALYALLGSSTQLSVGPESTTAIMTATALAPLAAGDGSRYAALAALLALLVGAICVIGHLFRLGFLADLLSRPILVGYLAGLALIMIVGQLDRATGVTVEGGTFVAELASFATHLGDLHPPTLALTAGVLVFLFAAQRWCPRLPAPLLAVLASTAVVAAFGLQADGIAVVGEIPAGLPTPRLPDVGLDDVAALLFPAFGIAVVGYSDNVLTGRSFAARRDAAVDANQELLALGACNLGAGLLQGFPVSSSASRTAIGDAAGSRSQLHSLVGVVCVLAVLVFLRPLLRHFPTAALAAIVVFAAVRLVDLREFRRLGRFRRSELGLALATSAAVLVVGILYGVLIAVGLSVLDVFRRVARPHDAVLGSVPGLAGLHDVDDYPQATTVPGLVVYRYDAPLFFANAEDFHRRVLAAVDAERTPVEWLVLNMEGVVALDITAADTLRELHGELARRGITLAMARVKQDLRHRLETAGLVELIGEDRLFPTLPTALEAFHARRRSGPPCDGTP